MDRVTIRNFIEKLINDRIQNSVTPTGGDLQITITIPKAERAEVMTALGNPEDEKGWVIRRINRMFNVEIFRHRIKNGEPDLIREDRPIIKEARPSNFEEVTEAVVNAQHKSKDLVITIPEGDVRDIVAGVKRRCAHNGWAIPDMSDNDIAKKEAEGNVNWNKNWQPPAGNPNDRSVTVTIPEAEVQPMLDGFKKRFSHNGWVLADEPDNEFLKHRIEETLEWNKNWKESDG